MKDTNYNQWTQFLKPFNLQWGDLQKTTSDIIKQNAEEQLQLVADNYSRLTDQLQRLSQVRNPEDYLSVQKDCFNENVSAMIRNGQTLTHLMAENIQALSHSMSAFCDSSLNKAQEAADKTAESTIHQTKRAHSHSK